jgi:hypothetical protein
MYNVDAFVHLELPYHREFLEELLAEFGWEFEDGKIHPVQTGNCSGHDPAAEGTLLVGWYENAAYNCPHCYPGSNPACLDWDADQNYIRLSGVPKSTKFQRMLNLAHKYRQALWNYAYKSWLDQGEDLSHYNNK